MRPITVALAQMAPILNDVARNLETMEGLIERACREHHVDLIVFPELCTTGYECGVRFTDFAEPKTGPIVERVASWASAYGLHIVFGMVERQKMESVLYSAALLVTPDGRVAGDYQKVHLWEEQRLIFRPGYRHVVAETDIGRVGLLIGWDLAFPEAARTCALEGAEMLCLCGSWPSPYEAPWHSLVRARAYENGLYVAASNRVGKEPSYTFCGESLLAGPYGEILARIEGTAIGVAVATIDLDYTHEVQEKTQIFQIRQPRSYRPLVRMY